MRSFCLLAIAHVFALAPVWAQEKETAPQPTELQKGQEAVADPGFLAALREDVDTLLDKLGLDFYGHFRLDMSRDSAETNFGDTAFFVKNYGTGGPDEEINITARHTRFGLNWTGPESDGIKARGKIEIDFLGKSTQKNTETQELQPAPRMRLAYVTFDFPNRWSMTAGQEWDVFGRPIMKKVNTLVGWGQGNIAFRRPMLKVAKSTSLGEKKDLTASFALARPVARDMTSDGDIQDDGEDSGAPDLQGHIGFKLPSAGKKPVTFGLGGFYGWREVGAAGTSLPGDYRYNSYALVADLTAPLPGKFTLIGEAFVGKALDGYRGGVWQSIKIDGAQVSTIRALGGFLNVMYTPQPNWRFVVGAGVDDPKDEDFLGQQGRYRNSTIFANAMYSFYPGGWVGLEIDRMDTDYRDNSAHNNRIQLAIIQKF